MTDGSVPHDDGYRWRHFAVAVDEGLLTRAADAFETYVRSADDRALASFLEGQGRARAERAWRITASVDRSSLRLEVRRAAQLAEAAAADGAKWNAAALRALAVAARRAEERVLRQRADPLAVRRQSWERLQEELARYRELTRLGAPEVIVDCALEELVGAMASLLPDERAECPTSPPPLERAQVLGDPPLIAPDLWDALHWLTTLTVEPFATPGLGIDEGLEVWPAQRAFRAEHPRAWPTTQSFWEAHDIYTLDSERVMDVYPDPALFRPPGLTFDRGFLPDWAAAHPDVRRAYPDPARIGVSEKGGPLTVARPEELTRHAARHRAVPPGASPGQAAMLEEFLLRCESAAGRRVTVLSWVLLDAPDP